MSCSLFVLSEENCLKGKYMEIRKKNIYGRVQQERGAIVRTLCMRVRARESESESESERHGAQKRD
jgi:hypothetical protein